MKQNLTKLLVKPNVKDEKLDEDDKAPVDEEYEAIFETMETVSDETKIRKRKQSKSVDVTKKKRKKKKCTSTE